MIAHGDVQQRVSPRGEAYTVATYTDEGGYPVSSSFYGHVTLWQAACLLEEYRRRAPAIEEARR